MTPEEAYALVPQLDCKGLCHGSCGPIGCSGAEAAALQDRGIALPKPVDHPTHGPLTCSHLSDEGRCRIYGHRPLVCRLFGNVPGMKCPHGCRPRAGYLADTVAVGLMDALDASSDQPPYRGDR